MDFLNATRRNNASDGAKDSSAVSACMAPFIAPLYTDALPILAIIGIVLNSGFLAIIRFTSFRCEITGTYVKAILISDLGFLVFALFPWIQMVFQINVYHNVGFCQLVNFAMTVFPSLSLFFILSFAINGVVWKTRPWLRPELPEVVGSKFLLVGITFFAVFLQVYPFWFWESSAETSNQCTVHYDNLRYYDVFLKCDMFLDFLVQLALIALGVGFALWSQNCTTPQGTTSVSAPIDSTPASPGNTHRDVSFLNFRKIFGVFLVSVAFLSLPTNVLVLARLYFPTTAFDIRADLILVLFYIHFAVKPFGYMIARAEFRNKVKMPIDGNVNESYVGEESESLYSYK